MYMYICIPIYLKMHMISSPQSVWVFLSKFYVSEILFVPSTMSLDSLSTKNSYANTILLF